MAEEGQTLVMGAYVRFKRTSAPVKKEQVRGATLPDVSQAAARVAGVKRDDLWWNVVPAGLDGSVWFKAWDDDIEMHVGPTVGEVLPSLSPDRGYRWDVLWPHVELKASPTRHLGSCFPAERRTPRPARSRNESQKDFLKRQREWEKAREGEAARTGYFIIEYPKHPKTWTAADLSRVLGRFVARLPPLTDDSWHIRFAPAPRHAHSGDGARWNYHLHAQPNRFTHDWTAQLMLPVFPASALIEWVRTEKGVVGLFMEPERLAKLAKVPLPATPATRTKKGGAR